MKKIGILVDSINCNLQVVDIVKQIKEEANVELYLLVGTDKNIKELKERVYNHLFTLERKILSLFQSEIKEYNQIIDITKLIDHKPINLQAKNKKELIFTQNSIKKLQELNLDLIVNLNIKESIKGGILDKASKDGLISLSHNHPIAFWETYLREDSIKFTIKKLNNKTDEILFKGKIATMRVVSEMEVRLLQESSTYIIKIVAKYINDGTLPQVKNPILHDHLNLHTPSTLKQLHYLLKTTQLYTSLIFKRLILKKYPRFHVAFLWSDWSNARLSDGVEIKTPPNHFYADPFVWRKDGKTVCFLEDYDYGENIAWISAVELFEDRSYKILGEVIKEPFHLSFPYIFEYKNELYMVPESTASNSIRLYKCIEFPLKWEYQKDLLKDIKTADTMIFEHKNRWWLFTNQSTPNNSDQAAQLFAYYSHSPLSTTWHSHSLNPIHFNSNSGRNGGIVNLDNKEPIRARQKQKFNTYGAAFSLAKITELSPTTYKEEEICKITPNFFPNIKATHHIHSNGNVTVYDFMRYEKLN